MAAGRVRSGRNDFPIARPRVSDPDYKTRQHPAEVRRAEPGFPASPPPPGKLRLS